MILKKHGLVLEKTMKRVDRKEIDEKVIEKMRMRVVEMNRN